MRKRLKLRRVPFVEQHSQTECGLACIAMILSYCGRATTVSEVRNLFPVGRDGIDLKRIAAMAAYFGLGMKVFRTMGTDMSNLELPVMVHWRFSHWVILESYGQRGATILDPAIGRQRLTAQEFSDAFTGIVISLKPNNQFRKKRRTYRSPTWKFVYQVVKRDKLWHLLPLIVTSSVLLQLLSLATPMAMKIAVDALLVHHLSSPVSLVAVATILIVLTQAGASLLRALSVLRFRTNVDLGASTGVLKELLKLPYSFFQVHSRGDLISRITGFGTIRQIVTDHGIAAALDGVFMVVYLVWLLAMSPLLAALITGLAGLQALALVVSSAPQKRLARVMYAASAEEMSCLVDTLSGIEYLKASGSEGAAWSRWSGLLHAEIDAENRRNYLNLLINVTTRICSIGGPLAVLWVGTKLVLEGTLSPGAMLSAAAVAAAVFGPLANSIYVLQQLQSAAAQVERVDDVIASPKELDPENAPHTTAGAIDVENVSFVYPGSSSPAIRNVSFNVARGSSLAFVGATGSGKSTLAMLLIGLCVPNAGEIYYDSTALSTLNRSTLRKQIGYVPQSPLLFRGSVRDNISFGMPEATLEDVIAAAKLACVHDELAGLPLGYDTPVSEQGLNFSGGQRQRIALARALIRRPQILVLDEATSHLDSETESRIDSMLSELSCTRILIAHRLSTIRAADKILVLEKGTVVEEGKHHDLLVRGGLYAGMTKAQEAYAE